MHEGDPLDPDDAPTLGPDDPVPGEGKDADGKTPEPFRGETLLEFAGVTGPPPTPDSGEAPTRAAARGDRPPPGGRAAGGPPETLGPYEILEEIGRGGMGVVYKAHHPGLKRVVALKVLIAGEDASGTAIERFHREAEAVARLGHHPNIVPVYDIGTHGRLHYIAMHFVEGKPLDRRIRDGEVAPKRAAVLAEHAARALHHAHVQGILHRDIKPANILVTPEGEPQITDFGLAKDVRDGSQMTATGITLGTPQYMPPEQADGRLDDIDARSDVYSLGATLYEMLAHEPPFTGTTHQNVIFKVLQTEVVPPRRKNPAVPRDLQTICLKAMEKEPARRYASALDMADDIARFLRGEPIVARPASVLYRLGKRMRRNLPFTLTTLAGILLLAAALVYFIALEPSWRRRQEVADDLRTLETALDRHLDPERRAAALLEKGAASLRAGDSAACLAASDALLDAFGPLAGKVPGAPPELRHRELLRRDAFRPLFAPRRIPVARALALKARALAALGRDEDALHSWLIAYARARLADDPEESAVRAPALLEIGRRHMARGEGDLARRTACKFLREFPGHPDAPRAWFLLGEALWAGADYAGALEALRRAGDGAGLPDDERAAAEDYRAWSRRLSRPRGFVLPGNRHLFPADFDGDGRMEVAHLGEEDGLRVYRIGDDGLEPVFQRTLESVFGPPAAGAYMRTFAWSPLPGSGRSTLLAAFDLDGAFRFCVVPFEGDAPAAPAWGSLHPDHWSASTLDVDGDGTPEFVFSTTYAGHAAVVFTMRDGAPAELGRFTPMSYSCGTRVVDLEGDGAEDLCLSLEKFSHFAPWAASWKPASQTLRFEPITPYRFRGPLIGVTQEEDGSRAAWVNSRPDHVARLIFPAICEPARVLPPGVHRLPLAGGAGPVDESAPLRAQGVAPWDGVLLDAERILFLSSRLPGGGACVAARPLASGRAWTVLPTPGPHLPNLSLSADYDGDGTRDLLVLAGNEGTLYDGRGPAPDAPGTLLAAGAGETSPAAGLENPLLQTAVEMAAMHWHEEALLLYREAAPACDDAYEHRRALLGEADCLADLGRNTEAAAAYRRILETGACDAEALFAAANLLQREGDWAAVRDLLDRAAADPVLCTELRRWSEDLRGKISLLAEMDRRLPVVPCAEPDGSFVCTDPFLCRPSPDGGVDVHSDSARTVAFGRLFRYEGGPLRLEGSVVFHRQDWKNGPWMGLLRVDPPVPDIDAEPCGLGFGTATGDAQNIPALVFHLAFHGSPAPPERRIFFTHPVPFPVRVSFVLEFAPSLERTRFEMHVEGVEEAWKGWYPSPRALAPGLYFAGLRGGGERGDDPEYRGRFTLERLALVSATPCAPDATWDPTPGLLAPYRAAGALAQGRAIPSGLDALPEAAWDPALEQEPFRRRRGLCPSPRTAALLNRVAAALRSGDAAAVAETLRSALDAEPGPAAFAAGLATETLEEEEGTVLARALVEALCAEGGRRSLAVMRDLLAAPFEPQGGFKRACTGTFPALEAALREGGGEETALEAVFDLVDVIAPPRALDRGFRRTALAAQARLRSLRNEVQILHGTGHPREALVCVEALLAAFPDAARASYSAAWFFLAANDKAIRDPDRAAALAARAAEQAARPGDPDRGVLPFALAMLASAHAERGAFAEAVRRQEEAVAALLPEQAGYRGRLEEGLRRYRQQQEEEGR